jgi:hypothetical protein
MTDLTLTILFTGAAVVADAAWHEFRWWRARRQAVRRPTLTGRYALPPRDATGAFDR